MTFVSVSSFATPSFAATSGISAADTAWMIVATGLVLTLLKLVSLFVPLRVSLQQEMEGLDISQHGEALQ